METLVAAPDLGNADGLAAQWVGSRAPQGKPTRVLVVDDDTAIRALCSLMLQRAGHDVLEAEDGQRGLELARSEVPDLALLDVRMPGLGGFELAEALRGDSRTRGIPVVFVTAEADPASQARAHALGAAGYLPKPFDLHTLESLVALVAGDRSRKARQSRTKGARCGRITQPAIDAWRQQRRPHGRARGRLRPHPVLLRVLG